MSETCKTLGEYCIIKHCFFYNDEKEPYFAVIPETFDTRLAAEEAASRLSIDEAATFNKEKVIDGLGFRGDEVDLEGYASCTTAWDGDDYYKVTGYIILKNLSRGGRKYAKTNRSHKS